MDGDENLEPSLAGFTGGLDDRENDGDDREPSEDGETASWSIDPDIRQEGPDWHHNGW